MAVRTSCELHLACTAGLTICMRARRILAAGTAVMVTLGGAVLERLALLLLLVTVLGSLSHADLVLERGATRSHSFGQHGWAVKLTGAGLRRGSQGSQQHSVRGSISSNT